MSVKLSNSEAKELMLASKLKPLEPYPGSGKPWKCRCQVCKSICTPTLGNIRQGRGGCAKCGKSKRAVGRLLKDDITIAEMLKKGLKPLEPYKGAQAKWECECLICHRITFLTYWTIRNSTSNKKGCAICVGIEVDPKEAIQWMLKGRVRPLEPYKGNNEPWKSKCLDCGKIVYPTYHSCRAGQGGCGSCRYVKASKSLRMPEDKALAIMAKSNIRPKVGYVNNNTPWKSECLICMRAISPTLANVVKNKGGCKYCATNAPIDSIKAIALMRKQKLEPLAKFVSGKAKWKCRCLRCGKISYPRYSSIRQLSKEEDITGCKYCNIRYVDTTDAIKVMIDAKLLPLVPYVNARKAWKCRCLNCKKIVSPTFDAVSHGKGCSYCSGNKVDAKDAKKIMLKAGYKPLTPYTDSKSRWMCIHAKCGREVNAPFERINAGAGACRYCTNYGFQHGEKAVVYLITHPALNAHKVGIGNPSDLKGNDRIAKHKKYGWEVYRTWAFDDGKDAQKVEKETLRVIRKEMSLPIFLSPAEMPQAGHTETVDSDAITLLQLENLINRVIKRIK